MRSTVAATPRKPDPPRSALGIIFLIVFLDLLGFSFIIPLFPEYRVHFGLSATAVTLLNTCYSLAQFLCAPLLGRLSDRVGRKPVLLYSLFGSSIGFLLFGAASTPWVLFAARILDGVTGGNIATAQAYIADVTTRENRAKGMGLIGAAFGLGFILGPALGGLLGRFGLGVPAFAAAGLALLNCVLVALKLPESRNLATASRAGGARTSDLRRLGSALLHPTIGDLLLVILVNMIAFAALENTIGLFTKDRFGFDQTHNGYLFAGLGVLMAVVQGLLIGRLARRFGEPTLVVTGVVLTTASFALIPLAPSIPLFLAAGVPLALGNALFTPSLNALISKSASGDEQGGILGLSQGLSSLGRVIGPVAGGVLYDRLGPDSPFFGGAGLMLICVWLAVLVWRRRRAPQPTAA